MVDIATLLQYLFSGDILGLLQAIYVSAFLSADIWYGVLVLLFTAPLYIRTKSLTLMAILWIMLGSLIIVTLPLVSGIAFLLVVIGFAGILFKIFLSVRGR